MDIDTKAWCLFCGGVFLWMGGSLLLGAQEHAESALAWMARERRADITSRRRLSFFYRCGGAAWGAFGLWLLWKTLHDPASLAAWAPRPRLGRFGTAAGGLFFLLNGSVLAAVKAAASLRGGFGGEALRAELGLAAEQESFLERSRRAWGWGIVIVFLAFGAWLVRQAAGR
jgi:hypothetical protein